jgi:hypothetical protein
MNEQEFLDFWKAIGWPREKTVYYRLYYNDSGKPLFYSHEDPPGKYINVTPEQFALGDMQVRVVDGVLTPRARPLPPKLVPGYQGTPCYPNDVAVVVSEQQPHQRWKLKTHEQN